MDRIVNAISGDGMVRIRVLEGKNMVEEARRIHNTTPTTTALLGRVIMAASLMGSDMKNEKDSLTLRINGNGPAGQVLAVADSGGFVRGYVQRPAIALPLNPQGKLDVGGAVMGKPEDNLENKGTLTVIKDLGLKEPYVGQIDLVSGEIGDDVTAYLFQSEQIPSVCGLGVLVDTDCSVKVAGGFILALMPGADESVISRVEADVAALPSVTSMLDGGMKAEHIAAMALKSNFGSVVQVRETGYACRCSEGRVENAILSLGMEELHKMEKEMSLIEVSCQFCDKVYRFDPKEMREKFENK